MNNNNVHSLKYYFLILFFSYRKISVSTSHFFSFKQNNFYRKNVALYDLDKLPSDIVLLFLYSTCHVAYSWIEPLGNTKIFLCLFIFLFHKKVNIMQACNLKIKRYSFLLLDHVFFNLRYIGRNLYFFL